MVEEGRLDPLLYFMSDEAWFHLSGYDIPRTRAIGLLKIRT